MRRQGDKARTSQVAADSLLDLLPLPYCYYSTTVMFQSPLRSLLLLSRPALLAYKPPPTPTARALHLPRSHLPVSSPLSPYIAQLRSAFARPLPATTTRYFSSSPRARGPRPYYRGGSSGSGDYTRGGAGSSAWRYKIDRLSPNTILYSIIGQSTSLLKPSQRDRKLTSAFMLTRMTIFRPQRHRLPHVAIRPICATTVQGPSLLSLASRAAR
jgi:hypothetical protein